MRALLSGGRAAALLALLALGACQPLPQPLAETAPPPDSPLMATPRDGAGIYVARVEGVDPALGDTLAAAMAKGLQDADVPASATSASKASFQLRGRVEEKPGEAGRLLVRVLWALAEPDGAPIGTREQKFDVPQEGWRAGDPVLTKRLAANVAPQLARLLQPEEPGNAAAPVADLPVLVRSAKGAPGDGGNSLPQAMRAALRNAKLKVGDSATASGQAFALDCAVELGKPEGGRQRIRIVWVLAGPDGAQIGQIAQENAVPAGSLDKSWGEIAYAIADAAADGVKALIDKARAAKT